jgi:hypothetical protein
MQEVSDGKGRDIHDMLKLRKRAEEALQGQPDDTL